MVRTWASAFVLSWKILVFAISLILLPAVATRGADAPGRKGVLLLYDENGDFTGLANLDRSLKAALGKEPSQAVDIYTEFMDVSRFRDNDYEARLRDFYRAKYAGKRIHLMVGVMAPSLDFLLKHGEAIAPGAPIVFCGIDSRELEGRTIPSNMTGVLVKREFGPTLETALRLQPHTRQVVFISGTSPFNQYWSQQARHELSPFESRVKINYMTNHPMESILSEVSRLPADSIVLFLHLFRDAGGNTFKPNESLSLVAAKAKVPVYVFFDQYVGSGAVGGFVYSVEAHGTKAAEIANRVLAGEKPSVIPIEEASTNVSMYDARELRRFHLRESQLPPNSIVRFREPSFWQQYRWHVAGAVAIIIAQAVLILALLFERRRRSGAELARKKAQAEVHQKRAELAHVSRVAAMGELTATLAHEINQPLTAILSNSSTALRFLQAPQPALQDVQETLEDIRQDAERAGEVVHRIRDMLRRDSPDFSNVDINQIIRSVEGIVHSDAILHDVTVELKLAPGSVTIRGDSVQLQQVILNLVLNAFAAMTGPQQAERRRVVLKTSTDGASVRVKVRDSGTGIPPETLDTIFEPFVTSKPNGLGMGLAICRSIIERHGGKLWAKNNPDRGATFTIALPLA